MQSTEKKAYTRLKQHCFPNFVLNHWINYTTCDIEAYICYRSEPNLDPCENDINEYLAVIHKNPRKYVFFSLCPSASVHTRLGELRQSRCCVKVIISNATSIVAYH